MISMTTSQPAPVPDEPRGIGIRFRRPLTDDELGAIKRAAKRRSKSGGLDGAFRATWDILLGDAEGMTMDDAYDSGLRFHPAEYAIPQSQSEQLLAIWREHRGPRYPKESAAEMLWLNMGPASYPDGDPTA
jgi:hypothetical protein